ncbi:TolC family protein [Zavarzinella formosa]|uniref:TolC family protein n=1 Tax=Zavarzinella formosa TaxID=360055 RepID=UPI000300D94F|nr:TolC family protein [Zavarzinella formosa]
MSGLGKMNKRGCLAVALLASVAGCAVHQIQDDAGDHVFAGKIDDSTPEKINAPLPEVIVESPPSEPAEPVAVGFASTRPKDIAEAGFAADQPAGVKDPDPKPAAKSQPDSLPAPKEAPAAKGAMTMDQLINAALLADPKLRAGFEGINQANADALTASLRPNPELFTDAQLLPLTRPFTVTRQGGPPQQDVNLSYSIDWFLFGKRAAAMQAALLGVRVSESEYADRVRQRILEAATAYYDVLEGKALLELARQDVSNLKRVEAVTEKAIEIGGRPQVDLNRIRLDRLKSEQAVRDAENTLVGARATLRSIIGRADADVDFDVAGTLGDKTLMEPLPVEEAFAVAQQNRPDLSAMRLRVSQARAGIESERRKGYPTVTPQLGYTRQYQQKAVGFPDASSYSVALTMSLPISDRNQGNVDKATSVMVQNQFEFQAGLVSLRADVVQADQELRTSAANAQAVAGEQLKLAAQVRDAINTAYEAGGRPLIDVLDAQRNYRETYRLFINSRAGYGRALVKYYSTIGKKISP